MRKTDALFQLIKSLNKAEKRNFKLLTQLTSGNKKYIQLFDAIDKQDEYNETRVIRQFKNDSLTRQFSVAKNYLYNSVLKSLAYYHRSHDAELNHLALQIKILIDKNLYPHAQKLLRKLKKKAERQEKFHELMDLLSLERIILKDMQDYKKFRIMIKEIREEELELKQRIDNLLAYTHLHDEIYNITTFSSNQSREEDLAVFEEILKDPLMQDRSNCMSARAEIIFLSIHWANHYYRAEYYESIKYTREALKIFDKNKELKESWITRYVSELYNYSLTCLVVKDFAKAEEVLEQMINIDTRSEKASISVVERYFALKFGQTTALGDVEEGKRTIQQLETKLRLYEGKLNKAKELQIKYFASFQCFIAADYPSALKWINRFLNEPRTEVRTDLQCMARLLNLVIHYELNNYDLLEHNLKSTYRFIFKKDRMNKMERSFLQYLKRLTKTGEEDKTEILREWKELLDSLVDDPYEFIALNVLDIRSWLDAKLEGVPMYEIKKRKFDLAVQKQELLRKTKKLQAEN